jgi:hypothetical protein
MKNQSFTQYPYHFIPVILLLFFFAGVLPVAAQTCAYSISPNTRSVRAGNVFGTFTVTTTAGCGWGATSNASWITVSSPIGGNGSGNGTVEYSVAFNPTFVQRTGTITLRDQNAQVRGTHMVTQDAALSFVSLNPPRADFESPSDLILTITGTGFVLPATEAPGSRFHWNGTSGPDYTLSVDSSTQMKARIPKAELLIIGPVSVHVVNPDGASIGAGYSVANPLPVITAFSPESRVPNSGPFTLTINGIQFRSTSKATWQGSAVTTTFVSFTELKASVPGDQVSEGLKSVKVSSPTPGGGDSTLDFCIYNLSPVIRSHGPVAQTGSVSVPAQSQNCGWTARSNASWITITSGSNGNGRGSVVYSLAANPSPSERSGTLTIADQTFTIVQASNARPQLISLSPAAVTAGGEKFTLIVNGSNFVSSSKVALNGNERSTTFQGSTQLLADIPASDIAAVGSASITVVNEGGSSNSSALTICSGPCLTSLSPKSLPPGAEGFTLAVNGMNFTPPASGPSNISEAPPGGRISLDSPLKVSWNGQIRPTNFISTTQLTAEIPKAFLASATNAEIKLVNAGGSAVSNAQTFEVKVKTVATTLYYPRLVNNPSNDPTGLDNSEFTGIAVVNARDTGPASLLVTALDKLGAEISGLNITNPVAVTLDRANQLAIVDTQVWGSALTGTKPVGWFKVESTALGIVGFFLSFNGSLSVLDGADASSTVSTSFIFPEIEDQGFTQLHVANPNAQPASITFDLLRSDGSSRTSVVRTINGNGAVAEFFTGLFPGTAPNGSDYIRVTSDRGVVPYEHLGKSVQYVEGLRGQDATGGDTILYSPQYVVGGQVYRTTLSVVNLDSVSGTVTFEFIRDDGTPIGNAQTRSIASRGKIYITDQNFFVNAGASQFQGYVKITSSGPKLTGSVIFSDVARNTFSSALPFVSRLQRSVIFSQLASNETYFTGIAVTNPNATAANITIEVRDENANMIATKTETIAARQRKSQLLTQYFPELVSRNLSRGYIKLLADSDVASFALYGTISNSVLSSVPPQVVP